MGEDFNYQVNNFHKLRQLLRQLFVYGSCSREDAQLLGISKRKYEDELRRVRGIVPREYFQERYGKGKQVQLRFQYYKNRDNYLVDSFYFKSFTKKELSFYFLILQLLGEAGEPLTVVQLNEGLNLAYGYEEAEDCLLPTLKRQLKKLVHWDLVELVQGGERVDSEVTKRAYTAYTYRLKDFFFAPQSFSQSELRQLATAVAFFANTAVPTVPGHYLRDTIQETIQGAFGGAPSPSLFLFKYNYFHTVLDEEIAWSLLMAIANGQQVQLTYQAKERDRQGWVNQEQQSQGQQMLVVKPLRVVLDRQYGRWFLIAKGDFPRLSVYPLQRIAQVKQLPAFFNRAEYLEQLKQEFGSSWNLAGREEQGPYRVDVKFAVRNEVEGENLIHKLTEDFGAANLRKVDGGRGLILTLQVNSLGEMKPWLRSFGARAQVLASQEHDLKEQLQREWEEMLANYGIVCGE